MQQELVDLIHKNYKKYMKYAMRLAFGKKEVAEDIVQNAIAYIIEKRIEFEIHNAHAFILTIMKQRYFNYHRVNKKYLLSMFDTDAEFDVFVESKSLVSQNDIFYEEDLHQSFNLKKVLCMVNELPQKQKHAILSTLEHDSIASAKGDGVPYDTHKANRRHGIDTIRKRLEK